MADIVLEHVTKRYPDGALAVDDINLSVADGEFVILVGPSGCGKTTTLNMIAGLEDISDGELRIGGKLVNNMAPRDRDIAMVFQSYALYPHMTVRENMAFALKLAKTPQAIIDQKVDEAARILDLTEQLDRKPANLSGGQRQRVAMGRCIVRDPVAFLMDEPLSNLDAKLRVQMRTELARLQKRLTTTTVYVTHDQTEAMTLGDRVAVMRCRTDPAVRPAARALQEPAQPLRRRLHRVAGDELHAGHVRGRSTALAAGRHVDQRRDAPAPRQPQRPKRHPRCAAGELRGRLSRARSGSGARHHVLGHDRSTGVHGLRRVRLLHARRGAGARAPSSTSWRVDSGRADTGADGDQVVARLDAATPIREGDTALLWVDTRAVHVFDRDSGENLTHPQRVTNAVAVGS